MSISKRLLFSFVLFSILVCVAGAYNFFIIKSINHHISIERAYLSFKSNVLDSSNHIRYYNTLKKQNELLRLRNDFEESMNAAELWLNAFLYGTKSDNFKDSKIYHLWEKGRYEQQGVHIPEGDELFDSYDVIHEYFIIFRKISYELMNIHWEELQAEQNVEESVNIEKDLREKLTKMLKMKSISYLSSEALFIKKNVASFEKWFAAIKKVKRRVKSKKLKTIIDRYFETAKKAAFSVRKYSILTANKRIKSKEMNIILDQIERRVTHLEKYTLNFVNDVKKQSYIISFVLPILIFVLSIMLGIIITRSITKPIRLLRKVVRRVGDGKSIEGMEIRTRDEIEDLYWSFKHMTERLQKVNVSKGYMENIIDSINELLIVINRDGIIQSVNQATVDTLRYSRDELVGASLNQLLEKGHGEHLISVLTSMGFIGQAEKSLFTKDKKRIPVLISGSIMRGNDKDIEGIVCVARNISEQIQANKEKQEMQMKMFQSEKLASIGELAAGVGHEINNPLAVINGNIEVLKNYFSQLEDDRENWKLPLEKQEDAVKRIIDIVNGLRTFARTESDIIETMNLNEVIEDTLSFLEVIYTKKGITIDRKLTSQKINVDGNIGKMQQVIVNLLTNAEHATEKNKERRISIETTVEDDKAIFRIGDNGIGIAQEDIPKIFRQFYTTKRVGKGTGLGMTIINNIIRNIDGRIEVKSEVGKGTSMIVKLPLSTNEAVSPHKDERIVEITQLSGKVLIVDDEEDIREILTMFLEEFGLEVHEAENGVEALKFVQKNQYQYVLTDLQMPEMNGLDFIREARKREILNGKVLIISGAVNIDFEDIEVDGVIAKPFSKESIYKAMVL